MRCANCGKKVENEDVFCENCKKVLKKESNNKEIEELEKEIEYNKYLNEDENTKELPNLKDLNKQELIFDDDPIISVEEVKSESLKRENNNTVKTSENREEKYKEKKKKKKKKIIIVVIICIVLISIISIIIFLSLNKEEKVEEVKVDYKKVLKNYGKKIEDKLTEYEEIPEWENLIKNLKFTNTINCNIHEIYDDKKIYLDECKIDGKKVKYTYGTKQEKIIQATMKIYKKSNIYNDKSGNLVGEITCEGEKCEFINGFDNYVIVKENNLYNLYDYVNKKLLFGPFNDVSNLLYIDNTLYGIYYSENNIKNIYSLLSNSVLSNVDGKLINDFENYDPTLLYKYDMVILKDKNYNFVNLKTGKTNFTIEDNILKFEEDLKNNVLYMLTYKEDKNTFKIINNYGKYLFDEKEATYFKLLEDGLIIANNTSFRVYDLKLNEKVSSKTYESLITIFDDCALALDKTMIKLVDLNDNLLSSFELHIKYKVDKEKTGWATKDGKAGLYIYFKNTDIILFYDPETGEMEEI